jgi:hypothetical protein
MHTREEEGQDHGVAEAPDAPPALLRMKRSAW